MSQLNYIDGNELVFTNDMKEGIHSGGFSVKSIMMKAGMSPIMTVNGPNMQIGGNKSDNAKVSDLFNDLVVPNWTLSYNNRLFGGKYKEPQHNESDSEDEVVTDDLHERLLELVKQDNKNAKPTKKKITKRNMKKISKKSITKRNK